MKFGKSMPHYKTKNFIKKLYRIYSLKLVPGPFVFAKNQAQLPLENECFETTYLY